MIEVMDHVLAPPATVPREALARLGSLLTPRERADVITIYLDARRAVVDGPAVHAMRVTLDHVVREARADGREAADGASRLRDEVDALLQEPAGSVALFVRLADAGEVVRVDVPALDTLRASVGPRADVRPLCRALQAALPAGVATVDAERLVLLEWSDRRLTELWHDEIAVSERRSLVGPAHAHPRGIVGVAPGFETGAQRDLFEQRVADERARLIREAAARIPAEATERGWDVLVVAGPVDLSAHLVNGLGPQAPDVILAPRLERWRGPGELAAPVRDLVDASRARRASELVARLRDAAVPGSIGLAAVREALAEGRVATLVLPAAGWLDPDGEPTSADAMIADAMATGADVLVLPAGAEDALCAHEAAAAVRW